MLHMILMVYLLIPPVSVAVKELQRNDVFTDQFSSQCIEKCTIASFELEFRAKFYSVINSLSCETD